MSAAILESVERLSKLINDVLDLTTGDTRGVALERERVDMAGLVPRRGRDGAGRARQRRRRSSRPKSRRPPATCSATRAGCAKSVEHVLAERDRLHRPKGPDHRSRPTATRSRP